MEKIVKYKKEIAEFDSKDVEYIAVHFNQSDHENEFYAINICLGDKGNILGKYDTQEKTEKIAEDVRTFIDDEKLTEYTLPNK